MSSPLAIQHQALAKTGLLVPPVIFGTSCLGNLYEVVPDAVKLEISRQTFQHMPAPVALDSAGKYGAGLALEVIASNLRALGVKPGEVTISNKLGWYRIPLKGAEPTFEKGVWAGLSHDAEQRISKHGILECWEQGCELLGEYTPQMLSVHDPDEYLNAAKDAGDRARRRQDILDAYESLFELKRSGKAKAIGIGSKDWTVIRDLAKDLDFDWVMLACSFTIHKHPPELVQFIATLKDKGCFIINSAVFNAGFLTGGRFYDYRVPNPADPADAPLFAWREKYLALCREFNLKPAVPCVQFGFSAPGVKAVALNTSKPAHIRDNVEMATVSIPREFWARMKAAGLISADYPHL